MPTILTGLLESVNSISAASVPEQFGALAGVNTPSVASRNAIALTDALASGQVIDGGSRTFYVNGQINPSNSIRYPGGIMTQFRNIRIVQTSTAEPLRTLVISGISDFIMENIYIDESIRNKNVGDFSNDYSILVNACTNFTLNNLVISNGGRMTGIQCESSSNFICNSLIARNFSWTGTATDDTLQGLCMAICTDFVINNLQVYGFSGAPTVRPPGTPASTDNYTRGIAFDFCVRGIISGGQINGVDEAYDVTGGINQDMEFIGCYAINCGSWGFKIANTNNRILTRNCVAIRCGLGGFVCASTQTGTTSITYSDCVAEDIGSSGKWIIVEPVYGFRIQAQDDEQTFPSRVTYRDCVAEDNQAVPTMSYGWFCDSTNVVGSVNENINFRCYGATIANVLGQRTLSSMVTRTSNLSIPNATDTTVTWNSTQFDTASQFNGSTRMTPDFPGLQRLTIKANMAAPVLQGTVVLTLLKNGAAITESTVIETQPSGAQASFQLVHEDISVPGDYYEAQISQNSGAAVNLTGAQSWFLYEFIDNATTT